MEAAQPGEYDGLNVTHGETAKPSPQ